MHRYAMFAVMLGCGSVNSPGGNPGVGLDAGGADGGDASVAPGVCGDGVCSLDETATTCCADCGVCTDQLQVTMETGVANGLPGTGITPGGMAAGYFHYAGTGFTEMRFPMAVLDEPVAGAGYYWAQTFYFGTNGETGYTGLQASSACGGPGKRVIFAIWDAIAAAAAPGATCEPFGGEGTGYHCCAAFGWRQDVVYTFIIRELADHQWQMLVHDPAAGADRPIGTITAAASYGRLTSTTTAFTEYFRTVNACTTTPHARARLYRPTADGVPATGVDLVTYGTCMAQATASCTGAACTR